jgi:hypothetical protein
MVDQRIIGRSGGARQLRERQQRLGGAVPGPSLARKSSSASALDAPTTRCVGRSNVSTPRRYQLSSPHPA